MRVGILTASDRCSRGERNDESGKIILDSIRQINGEITAYEITADDYEIISSTLISMSDKLGSDIILTTGGTGFSPRDVTPEATLAVIDRLVPGISEAIRLKGMEKTPFSILSRAVAGIRNRTLIINLPGSPKAVSESLEVILPVLPHAIGLLRGEASDCSTDMVDESNFIIC